MSAAQPDILEFQIAENQSAERLDRYLANHIAGKSRAYLQALIQAGDVLVDGKIVKPSHKISPGEQVVVRLKDRPAPENIQPENIPLDIIFEDESLLVVNKPAGMVVHPAYANYSGTLVNALMHHYQNGLSTLSGPHRPGIVHRLDKDTSGLLVVAKNDEVHAALSRQFAEKSAARIYTAIVWGHPKEQEMLIETQLIRSQKDRRKMVITEEGGKQAITLARVEEHFHLCSLVELHLRTGRTHQIRVHMAWVGHPVVGDATYGGRRQAIVALNQEKTQAAVEILKMMPRQALHARELRFVHPATGEQMSFGCPVPEDMRLLLAHLQAEKK